MKKIVVLSIFVCVFVAVSAFAQQNKVVVVPLSSSKLPTGLKTISVSSIGGNVKSSAATYSTTSGCGYVGLYNSGAQFSTTYYVAIPIQLPDGATVDSFSFIFCDQSPNYNGVAYLKRSDNTTLASVISNGPGTSDPYIATDTTITEAVINNTNYSYWVELSLSADNGDIFPIGAYVTLQ